MSTANYWGRPTSDGLQSLSASLNHFSQQRTVLWICNCSILCSHKSSGLFYCIKGNFSFCKIILSETLDVYSSQICPFLFDFSSRLSVLISWITFFWWNSTTVWGIEFNLMTIYSLLKISFQFWKIIFIIWVPWYTKSHTIIRVWFIHFNRNSILCSCFSFLLGFPSIAGLRKTMDFCQQMHINLVHICSESAA